MRPSVWTLAVPGSIAALAIVVCGTSALRGQAPQFRYRAPIVVQTTAPFVALPLTVDVYAHSLAPNLADLRVVDADGRTIPFTLLGPRAARIETTERLSDAMVYPLPSKPATDGTWTAPIELTVEGERIRVKRRAGTRIVDDQPHRPAGWLIDLGAREANEPAPRAVRFAWSGPAEFSAGFRFETSNDLRRWSFDGSGQLMALASPSGTLAQPNLVLSTSSGRFVRLIWNDAADAPEITGALAVFPEARALAVDPPTELTFAPVDPPADARPARTVYFDLRGALPVVRAEIQWPDGIHIAPVRLEGRVKATDSWWPLSSGVFYRLERDGIVSTAGPLPIGAATRYLRVTPDERAGTLDVRQTRLVAWVQLTTLVFASEGRAPYVLQAGASSASAGALPAGTLVPSLDEERPRFGHATVGTWSEATEVANQEAASRQRATLRLVLLWSVLVGGVAALGYMVWRLSRRS
jgi:hypothetical protein